MSNVLSLCNVIYACFIVICFARCFCHVLLLTNVTHTHTWDLFSIKHADCSCHKRTFCQKLLMVTYEASLIKCLLWNFADWVIWGLLYHALLGNVRPKTDFLALYTFPSLSDWLTEWHLRLFWHLNTVTTRANRQRPKRKINIVMSGEFCNLVMISPSFLRYRA